MDITGRPFAYLLKLKWWDWDIEKIEANFEALSSNDLSLNKEIKYEESNRNFNQSSSRL